MADDSTFIVHDSDGSTWSDKDSEYTEADGPTGGTDTDSSEDEDGLSTFTTEDELSTLAEDKTRILPLGRGRRIRGTVSDKGRDKQLEDISTEEEVESQTDTEWDETASSDESEESIEKSAGGSNDNRDETPLVVPRSIRTSCLNTIRRSARLKRND